MQTRRLAALADQGIVSATNFLLFLYCARTLDSEDWGAFGFAYAAVLFCQGFQRAIVTIPMITLSPTPAQWHENSEAWAGLNSSLLLAVMVFGGMLSAFTTLIDVDWLAISATSATALSAPMLLMEYSRRATIQNDHFGRLVFMALAYMFGILTIAILWPSAWHTRWLPVAAVIAGSCAAAFVFLTGKTSILLGKVRPGFAIEGHRGFSMWAALSHLGYSGYNFGVQAMLGAISGPAALGIFHACRALIQPVNTLIGAMDSIDKPRAARAYAATGRFGLFRSLRSTLMGLAILGGVYLGLAALFDTWLLRIAFGARYSDQESVVLWWCIVSALTICAQPVESGLYVAGRTREMFLSRVASSLGSLGCAYFLIGPFGPVGALAAMAVGFGVSALLGSLILKKMA